MLVLLKKTVIDMNEKGTVQLFEKQNLLHDALLLLVRHQFAHEHLFHGHLFWQSLLQKSKSKKEREGRLGQRPHNNMKLFYG